MINQILTCEEIIEDHLLDSSVTMVRELLGEKLYIREYPFYLDTDHMNVEFKDILDQYFSQRISASDKIHLFKLKQGVVFGQGSVVSANGSLIKNSAAEFINHNLAPDGSSLSSNLYTIDNISKLNTVSGTSILVKRPWYLNYGHWLVDLMPILPLTKNSLPEIDNIIFGDAPFGNIRTMMERTASMIYPNAQLIFSNDADVLRCEELYYVRPVHVPPLFKHPGAIERTVETAKMLFPCQVPIQLKKIYISRDRSHFRKVANESELSNYLSENGFTTVYPETMGIAEQISLFENAEIVIGVKGAALTNSIFCASNCHVILLSPSKFVDPFFWDIISQRGIKYSEIYCEDILNGASSNPSHSDLRVEIASVNAALSN